MCGICHKMAFAYGAYRLSKYYRGIASTRNSWLEGTSWSENPRLLSGVYSTTGGLLDSAAGDQLHDLYKTGFLSRLKDRILRGGQIAYELPASKYKNTMPKRKFKNGGQSMPKRRKIYKKKYNSRPGGGLISKAHNFSTKSRKGYSKKFKKVLAFHNKIDRALDATAGRQITINTCNQTISASANENDSGAFYLNTLFNGTAAENFGDLSRVMGHAFNTLDASIFRTDERNRLYLKGVHVSFSLRDTATSNARIKIYECICRKTCTNAEMFGGDWATTIAGNLESARSLTNAAALTVTHPMWSPYTMHNWLKFFKILDCHDIYLESSQSLYVNKSYKYNRFIAPSKHVRDYHIKGLTRCFIFVVQGDLDTTSGQNSAASVKIEMNVQHTYCTQGTQTNLITVGGDRPA